MSLPRWVVAFLRRLSPADRVVDLLGDLEEVHRRRVARRGRWIASLLTSAEAVETAVALLRARRGLRQLASSRPTRPGFVRASGKAPPISSLDLKLGLRMLVKYPGLTLVGGFAMAFAIWVGAGGFEFFTQVVHPRIPLDEGDRIVGIRVADAQANRNETRILHDFGGWRRDLSSVADLCAVRPVQRNLVVQEERGEPLEAAETTASAFSLARVPALLGRTLVAADERLGAPAVVVIGYDVWRARFASDPGIVGRTVRVGDERATVVGVMPKGFAFPVNQSLWLPLRDDPVGYEPREGPSVYVFGRLAPGATLERAQAELDALGRRAARDRPDVYEHLRPRVLPLAQSILGLPRVVWLGLGSINLLLLLLLVLVCSNVALLVFARAAAREGEIAVRMAIGASRARVAGQLFAEALVLGSIAAVVGLAATGVGLRWFFATILREILEGAPPPFWAHPGLSPSTIVYAGVLTLLGAGIAGVVPALKVTGGDVDTRLRRMTSGGGGLRFGGVWTAVIVLQVAVTVTFPVVGWAVRREAQNIRALDVGFASQEFLTAQLWLERSTPRSLASDEARSAYAARFARTARALGERLEQEPAVAGVTFGSGLPGTYHPWRRIEMDAGGETPRDHLDQEGPGRRVAGAAVAPDYFDVLGVHVLQGRGFNVDDAEPNARTVIVNQSFVTRVLGDRNPIGRRLRYLGSDEGWDGVGLDDDPGPWYRIVGVVPDLGMTDGSAPGVIGAGLYHAVTAGNVRTGRIFVQVNGDARSFAGRLRSVAAEVDPSLGLGELQTADRAKDNNLRFYSFWLWLIVGVCSVALLLSLAGIYAVMSFTVARRTREIGVRVALGARPGRVVRTVLRRPLIQAGSGIGAGWVLTVLMLAEASWGGLRGLPWIQLVGYGALMTAVCFLAAVVPARRALAIEPTEALREDG